MASTTVSLGPEKDRNQEATVYIGNLDERVTDAIVWELMLQAGPVANVHLPKDRVSMSHQGYGFCEFLTEDDAEYAVRIMNQIKVFGKPIRVNKASSDRKPVDIGANLFIGNLDTNVDETMLYNAFSNFGQITQPAHVARDIATGTSRGHGFISFASFESADAAIAAMDNQFLMNKAINVQYAFKRDSGSGGERHGSQAERLLAAQAQKNGAMSALGTGMGTGIFANALAQPAPAPVPAFYPPPPPMAQAPLQAGYPTQLPPGFSPAPGQSPYGAVPPPPPGFAPSPYAPR